MSPSVILTHYDVAVPRTPAQSRAGARGFLSGHSSVQQEQRLLGVCPGGAGVPTLALEPWDHSATSVHYGPCHSRSRLPALSPGRHCSTTEKSPRAGSHWLSSCHMPTHQPITFLRDKPCIQPSGKAEKDHFLKVTQEGQSPDRNTGARQPPTGSPAGPPQHPHCHSPGSAWGV